MQRKDRKWGVGHPFESNVKGLNADDEFAFSCHAGLSCFTKCCRDVTIFLTPYDVAMIKRRLKMPSGQFLSRYTRTLLPSSPGLPVVILKMSEDESKRCPFVTPQGCSIYEDRPWSCRMYPLDYAPDGQGFHVIADPANCMGLGEEHTWKVGDYLESQGLGSYAYWDHLMEKFTTHPRLSKEKVENPRIQQMFRMALYDVDAFRRFVFQSRFLEIFEVDGATRQLIWEDDLELLRFGFRWLEFGLIDGQTLRIREDVIKKARGKGQPPL